MLDIIFTPAQVQAGHKEAVLNNALNEVFGLVATAAPTLALRRTDGSTVAVTELVDEDAPFLVDFWQETAKEIECELEDVPGKEIRDHILASPVVGQIHGEANRGTSQIRQMAFLNSKRNDKGAKYGPRIEKAKSELDALIVALDAVREFVEGFAG